MKLSYDCPSPITGKMTALVEGDRILCMETGYHTFKGWNEKDQHQIPFEEGSPETVLSSKITDDLGQFWFKITLFTDSIVLQPTHDGWSLNGFRDLKDGESSDNKLQRVQNEKVQIIDDDDAELFDNFTEAFEAFNKKINEG